jgi:hypothetical protein
LVIILHDDAVGKRYKIEGKDLCFEIFRESGGKKDKDGNVVGKGGWTSMRVYPTSLPLAVYKVLAFCLADQDDDDEVCVEADKARVALGKRVKERLDKIMLEVESCSS